MLKKKIVKFESRKLGTQGTKPLPSTACSPMSRFFPQDVLASILNLQLCKLLTLQTPLRALQLFPTPPPESPACGQPEKRAQRSHGADLPLLPFRAATAQHNVCAQMRHTFFPKSDFAVFIESNTYNAAKVTIKITPFREYSKGAPSQCEKRTKNDQNEEHQCCPWVSHHSISSPSTHSSPLHICGRPPQQYAWPPSAAFPEFPFFLHLSLLCSQ